MQEMEAKNEVIEVESKDIRNELNKLKVIVQEIAAQI